MADQEKDLEMQEVDHHHALGSSSSDSEGVDSQDEKGKRILHVHTSDTFTDDEDHETRGE